MEENGAGSVSELNRLLKEAFKEQKSEDILKRLCEVVDLFPNSDVAYFYRAYLNASFEEIDKALFDISKAIEINPKNKIFFNNRAFYKFLLDDIKGANIDFAKAACLDEDSLSTTCFVLSKDLDNIYFGNIKKYNALIESTTDGANLYLGRAILYYGLAEFDLAFSDLNKSIELYSSYSIAYYNRAILYLKMKCNEEAIADFSKAIELDPTFINAYMNRGILTSSISDLDEAIALYPYCSLAYKIRGQIKRASRRFKESCKDMDYSYNLRYIYPADISDVKVPTTSCDYQYIAEKKYQLDELEEAMKYYNEAVRLDNTNAEAISYRGRVSQDMGDKTKNIQHYKDALRDLNEGIRLGFVGADIFYYRGAAKEVLGDLNAAMQDYEEALRFDSEHEEAIRAKFYLQMSIGDYSEINPVIITFNPQTSIEYTDNAQAKINSENYEDSLEDLNKAIELDSNNDDAYKLRACVYRKLSETEKYIEQAKKYIELAKIDEAKEV